MSLNSRAPGPGGRQGRGGGGSVKRAREMLEAGVRKDNVDQSNTSQSRRQPPRPPAPSFAPKAPPPPRPKRPSYDDSNLDDATEGEINIGFQVDSDPRGPVPVMPIQGLPVPKHTGHPPTSRRGPSSLYFRVPFVSPIPEESPQLGREKKKGSFASSAVIPSSWGSDAPVSDILDFYESGDDSDGNRDPKALVRQASLGKRGKPSLRTINKPQPEAVAGEKNTSSDPVRDEQNRSNGYATSQELETRPSFESSSTDSDSIDLAKRIIAIETEQREDDGVLATAGPGMSSKKRNARRPPRLDLDAVRDAEARGSLTSLPDLIRRATRVASNLEHGRTASRLGMLDMFESGKDPKRPKPSHTRSSASLSDILASFPPPRTDTPDDAVRSSWPFPPVGASRLRNVQSNGEDEKTPKSRRICGMSLPLFVTLCIIAFLIVAAAVIIPIILVVVPRGKDQTVTTTSAANTTNNTTTTNCEQTLPCLNGGVSISTSNSCSCVCVDGFSGTQCGNATDGSCTTTKVSQTVNATVGSSLPRLFASSESNFSIPLNGTEILSLFNAQNVSCTVQNDLVFFNTRSSKERRGSPTEEQKPYITKAPRSGQVQEDDNVNPSSLDVPPILSVPSSTTTSTAKRGGAMQTASASSTSTSAPTSTSAASTANQHIFDFARVAVLFILEETQNIDAASTARSEISLALLPKSGGGDDAAVTNMKVAADKQDTFVLNFSNFTITLPNGTVVGGGNGTAT